MSSLRSDPTATTAWCTGHQAFEPVGEFGKHSKRGLQGSCRAAKKAHYEANREAIAVQQKVYRETNREAIAAQKKEYSAANREAESARGKAYREADPEAAAAYQKAYYEANREALIAHSKAYREANREAAAARGKAYYEANLEAVAARGKAYYEANREAHAAQAREWRAANPEKVKASFHRRRMLEANADGNFTGEELKDLLTFYGYRCLCCGQKEGDFSNRDGSLIKITADHVIPLSLGGSNSIDNIQPLCFSCNCRKNNLHATDYRLTFAITA
jgi:5-methylcytosine-specific restriction endonuclease McrA